MSAAVSSQTEVVRVAKGGVPPANTLGTFVMPPSRDPSASTKSIGGPCLSRKSINSIWEPTGDHWSRPTTVACSVTSSTELRQFSGERGPGEKFAAPTRTRGAGVGGVVGSGVDAAAGSGVGASVGPTVGATVGSGLSVSVRSTMGAVVGTGVGATGGSGVGVAVRSRVRAAAGPEVGSALLPESVSVAQPNTPARADTRSVATTTHMRSVIGSPRRLVQRASP